MATKRKALAVTVHPCRDCQRLVGWAHDVKDPKGPRCWDCMGKHRKGKKP